MGGLIEKIRLYGLSAAGGRDKLFGEIWERYGRKVLFFIREVTGRNAGHAEAEDLFQEVMLKVYEKLDLFNPAYALSTWIYTIARNHCMDYFRKRKVVHGPLDETTEYPDNKSTPEDAAVAGDLFARIGAYLEGLKQTDREIAYFRFYEEMKYSEIAQVTGIPEGTIKSKVFELRKKIAGHLEGKDENR
ncbi:MAG: hypothetical protein A2Y33_01075 [Spirochaetes bacterium GWF1_51_8]|nr:MAG: hypothetical protein A2Y33_01075 [Spirochaetes bacterium GWF1_51_8]